LKGEDYKEAINSLLKLFEGITINYDENNEVIVEKKKYDAHDEVIEKENIV
jgi:hypothetical protein